METDAPVPGGPCWAELGTSDVGAARRFYTGLFGWRPETVPGRATGGYTLARLAGTPVAGLAPLYRPEQPVGWDVAFAVADADAAARRVTASGGAVLSGPVDVTDAGRLVVAVDPGGAVFQLWQAGAFAGVAPPGVPGSLGWAELLTRAPERAADFYAAVLGWRLGGSGTSSASGGSARWSVGGTEFGSLVTMDDKFPHEVPAHWLPYFAVADVDRAAADATGGHGTVLMLPTSPPDGPRIAVLRDPQGAMFGVYGAGGGRG
ncbi:VOC family protein [Streptomyces sp. enrichment culture]|uniref:VOC family protein n=1 Tax=Streptomyces sp. enrichment culture TaxID=1795815 RepID=UPI003F571B79